MDRASAQTAPDTPTLAAASKIAWSCQSRLRAAGVRHLAIFGSVARGEANAASDIDILVDLDPAIPVSLFDLIGIELYLTDVFGRKVDVVSKRGLRPQLDDSILTDAVAIF